MLLYLSWGSIYINTQTLQLHFIGNKAYGISVNICDKKFQVRLAISADPNQSMLFYFTNTSPWCFMETVAFSSE